MLNRLRSYLSWLLMPMEERATVELKCATMDRLVQRLGPLGVSLILNPEYVVKIAEQEDLRDVVLH